MASERTSRPRSAGVLEPGARVVWAPVEPGTVVRSSGDRAYVVDLDDGQTITCGERLLVEVPEAPDAS